MLPIFEFDPAKSAANKQKHGIDFEEAQTLWRDGNRLEAPVQLEPELRYVVVGRIGTKYWTAVITYRNEKIRIISVRRARDREIERYENEQEENGADEVPGHNR